MPSAPRPFQTPNFDSVAHIYQWAEYLALGPLLQQTRMTHLDQLTRSRRALLFGDGDGRFLCRLLAHNPDLHAIAIDTSSTMLRLLRARCGKGSPTATARLSTVQVPALETTVPPGTDLVVSHFFFDCLYQDEVDDLVAKTAAALQPGALWLVSDFALPERPLLRSFARVYLRALYLAFRVLTSLRVQTLPDPQSALNRSGFRLLERRSRLFGMLYSELWVHEPAQPANPPHSSTP